MNEIKVVELFAGVGGFRLGLEGNKQRKSASSGYKKKLTSPYKVVWSNQWEPSTKTQHASMVYESVWGSEGHSNENLFDVVKHKIDSIPDHDLLVGGFPCQDYSVATTLKNSKGLVGKKGVLWWAIWDILFKKENKPSYLFLENVDRLLISPSGRRGRDFAIILKSLDQLGYAVEWRVINAADYGMPQRRRRVFILAYHKSTKIYNKLKSGDPGDWLQKNGVIAKSFSAKIVEDVRKINLPKTTQEASDKFNKEGLQTVFANTGLMIDGVCFTAKTAPAYKGKMAALGDYLEPENSLIDSSYFIQTESELEKWRNLKMAKKLERVRPDGSKYFYAEGGMAFPDNLDLPSRTIITGEGGKSPSRFKHVVATKAGYRRLVPTELERLNMFPVSHTEHPLVSDAKRAFFMGNALVVGVVEKIGIELAKQVSND